MGTEGDCGESFCPNEEEIQKWMNEAFDMVCANTERPVTKF